MIKMIPKTRVVDLLAPAIQWTSVMPLFCATSSIRSET